MLDFSVRSGQTSILNSAGLMDLAGGQVQISGLASANRTQTFNKLQLDPGASAVSVVTAGTMGVTTVLGAIMRNVGGTVDFSKTTKGTITTTSANGAAEFWAAGRRLRLAAAVGMGGQRD